MCELHIVIFCREKVIPGNIIIRQRGTKYRPGKNVGLGRDHTIYSRIRGYVAFDWDPIRKRQVVSVEETRRPIIPRIKKRLEAKKRDMARLLEEFPEYGFKYYGEEFEEFKKTYVKEVKITT